MKFIFPCIFTLTLLSAKAQTELTVLFDFNKYAITPSAKSSLDSFIAANQNELKSLQISLHGHCDAIGSHEYNDRLSKQRVAAVKKYFTSHGIEANSIRDEIGHGKKDPLNENTTPEERQLNRRVEISFNKNDNSVTTLKEKIADSTTIAGSTIVLRNINFVGGRHIFLSESSGALAELLDAMKTYPKLVIRVEGHICCIAGPEDGPDLDTGLPNLSEARAKAVQDYLIMNGIRSDRVSYKGFGHSIPLHPYPELTAEQQTENRRVEIKILKK